MDLQLTRGLSLNTFYGALFCTKSYNFTGDYSKGLGYVGKIDVRRGHRTTEPTIYQLHSSLIIQSPIHSVQIAEENSRVIVVFVWVAIASTLFQTSFPQRRSNNSSMLSPSVIILEYICPALGMWYRRSRSLLLV